MFSSNYISTVSSSRVTVDIINSGSEVGSSRITLGYPHSPANLSPYTWINLSASWSQWASPALAWKCLTWCSTWHLNRLEMEDLAYMYRQVHGVTEARMRRSACHAGWPVHSPLLFGVRFFSHTSILCLKNPNSVSYGSSSMRILVRVREALFASKIPEARPGLVGAVGCVRSTHWWSSG